MPLDWQQQYALSDKCRFHLDNWTMMIDMPCICSLNTMALQTEVAAQESQTCAVLLTGQVAYTGTTREQCLPAIVILTW